MTKGIKIVISAIAALAFAASISYAQEAISNEYPKHSVEISTGIPNLITLSAAPYGHDTFPEYEKEYGWKFDHLYMYNLNIAYVVESSRRWDFVTILDFGFGHYVKYNYREWVDIEDSDDMYPSGHWEGGPDRDGVKFQMGDINLTFGFRYKWAYTEHCKFYSALGVGISGAIAPLVPLPYITPLGISVGQSKRIYGFAEATLGTTGTLIQGGIGIRIGKI